MGGDATTIVGMHPLIAGIATACAVISIGILSWFLVRNPRFGAHTKIVLLFGFGVLPVMAGLMGSVTAFGHTKHRGFCGSCHVMEPYVEDSEDPLSPTLPARHARNEMFGEENCYQCHRDYGMFSTLLTKWGGMSHVWHYYTHYRTVPTEQAIQEFELYEPYANAKCMRCHSAEIDSWSRVGDHRSMAERIRSGKVSCVSEGCHGPAHPFSKPDHGSEEEGSE